MVPSRRQRVAAFTLIEVILAIVIALGILVVLLFYYQQATNLRAQAIQETERIASIRLLMDRITGELRCVESGASNAANFVGTSNSVEFVKSDVPPFTSWTGGALGRSASPATDRKLVSYRMESPDGTNVTGLLRLEMPLVDQPEEEFMTDLEQTNSVSQAAPPPPLFEEIRYLQFRYWGGTNWADSWRAANPPEAVEVSLGAEAATNGLEEAEYAGELFRRVIYLLGKTGPQLASTVVLTNRTDALAPPEEAP